MFSTWLCWLIVFCVILFLTSYKQRNKWINAWQKYKVRTGFEPETLCTKSQYHNLWAKENSPLRSCQVLYLNREAAIHEWVASGNKYYFSYIMASIAPIHPFLEFSQSIPILNIIFLSHWRLSLITIARTKVSSEGGTNSIKMANFSPQKEYWLSWESNQPYPAFNLFPHKPWILRVCITSCLKTL